MEEEAAEASTSDAECESRRGVYCRVSSDGGGTSNLLAVSGASVTAEALAGSPGQVCRSGDCKVTASYLSRVSDSQWRAGRNGEGRLKTASVVVEGAAVRLREREVSTEGFYRFSRKRRLRCRRGIKACECCRPDLGLRVGLRLHVRLRCTRG